MTRIGGFWLSIVRTCTGLVCVRRTLRSPVCVGLEEERVVHLARRMAGREVELGEIVVVALDVRPFGDRKAHLGENGGDLVHHLADRMDAPGLDARQGDGQRDVERLALELRLERRALEHRAARRERFRDLILQRIDRRAVGLALVRRELAERGEERGDRSLLAERGDARGLERAFVGRAFDRGERLPFKGGKVRHSSKSSRPRPLALSRLGGKRGPASPKSSPRSRAGRAIRPPQAAFGSEPFACSTIAANAAGSEMARSDSTLRSTSIPAAARPEINRL